MTKPPLKLRFAEAEANLFAEALDERCAHCGRWLFDAFENGPQYCDMPALNQEHSWPGYEALLENGRSEKEKSSATAESSEKTSSSAGALLDSALSELNISTQKDLDAIAEHAFRAGWSAGVSNLYKRSALKAALNVGEAWAAYDPQAS